MSQILLNGLNVIPGLQAVDSISMANIMKEEIRFA